MILGNSFLHLQAQLDLPSTGGKNTGQKVSWALGPIKICFSPWWPGATRLSLLLILY